MPAANISTTLSGGLMCISANSVCHGSAGDLAGKMDGQDCKSLLSPSAQPMAWRIATSLYAGRRPARR